MAWVLETLYYKSTVESVCGIQININGLTANRPSFGYIIIYYCCSRCCCYYYYFDTPMSLFLSLSLILTHTVQAILISQPSSILLHTWLQALASPWLLSCIARGAKHHPAAGRCTLTASVVQRHGHSPTFLGRGLAAGNLASERGALQPRPKTNLVRVELVISHGPRRRLVTTTSPQRENMTGCRSWKPSIHCCHSGTRRLPSPSMPVPGRTSFPLSLPFPPSQCMYVCIM
jgi:hypothetical protein